MRSSLTSSKPWLRSRDSGTLDGPICGGDDTITVDIRSLLKVPDSNESSDSPPNQPSRARAAPIPAPPPPAAVQAAAHPSARPAATATLAPAATITGGPQPVAGVAPSAGTLYAAAPAAPPPPGIYSWLGGGGYAPAEAALGGGGGPGFIPAAPGGSGSIGLRPRGPSPASKRSMPPHTAESPAKKQSKWSPEEDALIIELRGRSMKWEDISKRLPGRSAISCRLHYQNYLERRSEWDEERKNKLARLYERFKPEMWAKVAEEMQVPWRAAEAMHWQLGETDMARRAGVVPFSLSSVNVAQDANVNNNINNRQSPTRGHVHSQSQGSPLLYASVFTGWYECESQYHRKSETGGIAGSAPGLRRVTGKHTRIDEAREVKSGCWKAGYEEETLKITRTSDGWA
ncbi:Transcriptional activator Myb [Cytospora mali]|uniref:Transcriptional activator Myb n=1 Tax=Cytospora mali TaxID=578113 RepID=A0A194V9X1_CYTMA|nr:Transcriptional activator Myb [Valsa mali var. pyri (nom. inval.)]